MYLTPITYGNQQERNRRLTRLLLSNNIVTTTSLASKNFFELQKISSDEGNSALVEEYKKLREACDKKAYSVAWLDAIGDKITSAITPVIRPIVKTVQSVATTAKPVAQETAEESSKVITDIVSKTSSILPKNERFCKIAKFYDSDFNQLKIAEREILLFARQEGIKAESLEELSYKINMITKEAGIIGDTASKITGALGRGLKGIGKGLGAGFLKSLPLVGIVTDSTLMCKNLYEAWINGKKIISELPLDKYGISVSDATIPTPGNTAKISKQLENLCIQHKDSPSNLSEILEISQTLKGYGTDFVAVITNFLMVILDILEFFGLGLLISFVLSIPLMALEMANDTLVEENYNKSIDLIRSICDQKISELGQVNFSDKEKDFMRSFLNEDPEEKGALSRGSLVGSMLETPLESKAARLKNLNYLMKACH